MSNRQLTDNPDQPLVVGRFSLPVIRKQTAFCLVGVSSSLEVHIHATGATSREVAKLAYSAPLMCVPLRKGKVVIDDEPKREEKNTRCLEDPQQTIFRAFPFHLFCFVPKTVIPPHGRGGPGHDVDPRLGPPGAVPIRLERLPEGCRYQPQGRSGVRIDGSNCGGGPCRRTTSFTQGKDR